MDHTIYARRESSWIIQRDRARLEQLSSRSLENHLNESTSILSFLRLDIDHLLTVEFSRSFSQLNWLLYLHEL